MWRDESGRMHSTCPVQAYRQMGANESIYLVTRFLKEFSAGSYTPGSVRITKPAVVASSSLGGRSTPCVAREDA